MIEAQDEQEPTDAEMQAGLDRMSDDVRRNAFSVGEPIVFLRGNDVVWLYPDGREKTAPLASLASRAEVDGQ